MNGPQKLLYLPRPAMHAAGSKPPPVAPRCVANSAHSESETRRTAQRVRDEEDRTVVGKEDA